MILQNHGTLCVMRLKLQSRLLSKADVVVLLRPTTPLRTIGHIDKVIEKIVLGEFEAAMTIKR